MKNFRVTVNGNIYDVSVEELGEAQADQKQYVPSANNSTAGPEKALAAPAPVKKAAAPAGAAPVVSPMPGVVLDVKVAVGQKVEKNQVAVLLEAMKMENEIVVPEAGTVVSVDVAKGASVDTGAVLLTISK